MWVQFGNSVRALVGTIEKDVTCSWWFIPVSDIGAVGWYLWIVSGKHESSHSQIQSRSYQKKKNIPKPMILDLCVLARTECIKLNCNCNRFERQTIFNVRFSRSWHTKRRLSLLSAVGIVEWKSLTQWKCIWCDITKCISSKSTEMWFEFVSFSIKPELNLPKKCLQPHAECSI